MPRILTPEEVDELKDKNETSYDIRPLTRQEGRNLIKTVEALYEENEQLKRKIKEAEAEKEQAKYEEDLNIKFDATALYNKMKELREQMKNMKLGGIEQ